MFREGEHCVTISSFTKVHGLGVIRYGWIIADEKIIANVENSFHNMEGMMSSPSIRIVEHIKNRLDEPVQLIEHYREKNLPVLISALERLGIEYDILD